MAFKEAPTLKNVLTAQGAELNSLKRGQFLWRLGDRQGGLVYRIVEYAPFMEPNYQLPVPPQNLTSKQLDEYLKNIKPPKPLGTYVSAVLIVGLSADDRSRLAVQKLAGGVMSECFGFTPDQLTAAQVWLAAHWGQNANKKFGLFTVSLDSFQQQGQALSSVGLNFDDFGGHFPNQDHWQKFCRE